MGKSVAKNYAYNLAYQILILIVPLITTPYISRVLGVRQVGINSYVNTVVTYFSTFSQLGLNLYGRREIAYVRNDREKATGLFWQLVCIRGVNFTIGMLCYGVLIFSANRYTLYYSIYIIYFIANAVDITWFFQAYEEFRIITIRNFIIKMVNMLGIFVFVHSENDLWVYILMLSISEFVSQAVMWLGIREKIDFQIPSLYGMGALFKGSFIMFLPQVITTIYTLLDKLILGLLSNEVQVGLYSQSEKIIKLTMAVITSMGTVAMPRIANDFANGKMEMVAERLSKNRRFVFCLAVPMISGLFGIAENFTSWFFGSGYEEVSHLMVIISPIILLIALSDLYGMQYLVPTGHMREYTISTVAGAAVNVVLNILLVKKYAAAGVSVATVVSEFAVTSLMWVYSRRYVHLKSDNIYKYVAAGIMMGGIVKMIDRYNPESLVWTFGEVAIGIIIYSVLLLAARDRMMIEILNKVKTFIPWKRRK